MFQRLRLGRSLAFLQHRSKRVPMRSLSSQRSFTELRQQELKNNWAPYPPHFPVNTSISEFLAKYSDLAPGNRQESATVRLCGRIVVRRESGKKLVFLDVVTSEGKIQVMCMAQHYQADFKIIALLRIGDIIGVKGFPARTKAGELSVIPQELVLLSPCMHDLPAVLEDPELRWRSRYLDLLVNERTRQTFRTRSTLISAMRSYLQGKGFVEVETPILWSQAGGASARPFRTESVALGELVMRVAPELFLKQLVIGGFDKVFEIGKLFRNEGVDASHNPEFTSCEFYQAYANLDDLMLMTQDIVRALVQATLGKLQLTSPKGELLDFGAEFRRLEVMPSLEAQLKRKLPDPNLPSSLPEYESLCQSLGLVVAPVTLARCLDKLIGHVLEPLCVQPTFITHHPEVLSPLSKTGDKPGICQRFELFVDGKEIVNAYEELNDPEEQRRRFKLQSEGGDSETPVPDEAYCVALSYGLPPTVGWGMGLDRFCMLLCGHTHIRDVLLFPTMRQR